MKQIADRVRPRGVKIHASAEFTADMADNLVSIFQRTGDDERVTVNISNMGVWAVLDNGMRVFIGATEVFDQDGHTIEAAQVQ